MSREYIRERFNFRKATPFITSSCANRSVLLASAEFCWARAAVDFPLTNPLEMLSSTLKMIPRTLRATPAIARATPAMRMQAVRTPAAFPAMARTYASGGGLSKDEIKTRIEDVLKSFEKVDPTQVSTSASFVGDLGLDSLDAVEVVMAIEEEFNIVRTFPILLPC